MENNEGKLKDFSNSEDLVTQQLSLTSTYNDSQIIAQLLDTSRNSATLESYSTSHNGDKDGDASRDLERRNQVSTESHRIQEGSPKHMNNTGDIITHAWDGYIEGQLTGDNVEDEKLLSQNSTTCTQSALTQPNSEQGKSHEDAAGEGINHDGNAGNAEVADDLWLLMNVGGNTSKFLSLQDKNAPDKPDNQECKSKMLSAKVEQDENQEPAADSTEIVKKRRKRQPRIVSTDGNTCSKIAETSVRRSRRSRKAKVKGDIFGNVDSEGELVNNDEQSRVVSDEDKEMKNTDTMTDDPNLGGKVPCPQCGTVLANNASLTGNNASSGQITLMYSLQ